MRIISRAVPPAKLGLPERTHRVKTLTEHFLNTINGVKDFEVRNNDRDYRPRDGIILEEYNGDTGEYTDRAVPAIIIGVYDYPEYLQDGYVILQLNFI